MNRLLQDVYAQTKVMFNEDHPLNKQLRTALSQPEVDTVLAERKECANICKQAAEMSELAKEDLSGNETGAICFVEGAILQANKLCAAILARGQG